MNFTQNLNAVFLKIAVRNFQNLIFLIYGIQLWGKKTSLNFKCSGYNAWLVNKNTDSYAAWEQQSKTFCLNRGDSSSEVASIMLFP